MFTTVCKTFMPVTCLDTLQRAPRVLVLAYSPVGISFAVTPMKAHINIQIRVCFDLQMIYFSISTLVQPAVAHRRAERSSSINKQNKTKQTNNVVVFNPQANYTD
jgi:hypothetical protein